MDISDTEQIPTQKPVIRSTSIYFAIGIIILITVVATVSYSIGYSQGFVDRATKENASRSTLELPVANVTRTIIDRNIPTPIASPSPVLAGTIFTNEKYKYSFEYVNDGTLKYIGCASISSWMPADYTNGKEGEDEIIFYERIYSQSCIPTAGGRPALSVKVLSENAECEFSNTTLVKSPITIAGYSATKCVVSSRPDAPIKTYFVSAYFEKDGKFFVIEADKKYESVFNKIIASFKFY